MKKKENKYSRFDLILNDEFKRKGLIRILISLLIVLIIIFLLITHNSFLTGRFILDDDTLYISSNYSLPGVTIGQTKYLIFNITPDKFILNSSNASSQIITINVTVSWPSVVEEAVVYSFGYYYSVSNRDWIPFLLNGDRIIDSYGDPTNWINRTGTKKLTLNVSGGKFFEGTNFIVAYGCMKVEGKWECGCFDPSDGFSSQLKICDNWMMQLFNTTNVIGGVSGENTCVFSQNCPTGYYCNSQEICVVNTSYVAPSNIVYLNGCGTLGSANTHYILNKSLSGSTGEGNSCFYIEGDNITLDGAGYSIENITLGSSLGVSRNSLTFRNISFTSLDGSDSLGELVLNDTTILGIMLSGTIDRIRGNNFITESPLSASEIFLENSHVQNLNVSGKESSSPNGGNISLQNSIANNLEAKGFSFTCSSPSLVYAGNGGFVQLIDNSHVAIINVNGGSIMNCGDASYAGSGGRVIAKNSFMNEIFAMGENSRSSSSLVGHGGNGGNVELLNSSVEIIGANGGGKEGGNGGIIILNNSIVRRIQANANSYGALILGNGGIINISGDMGSGAVYSVNGAIILTQYPLTGASISSPPEVITPTGGYAGAIRLLEPCPGTFKLMMASFSCESSLRGVGNCTKTCPSNY